MNFETIRVDVENSIQTITLNRPDKLNAFNLPMMNELIAAFDAADANDAVRAVIVTGAGRGFCAGADLSRAARTFDRRARAATGGTPRAADGAIDWSRRGGARRRRARHAAHLRVLEAGHRRDQRPGGRHRRDHAAADGRAHRVESARIGFVFTRRGIVPEACSSWFLPRLVGISAGARNGRIGPRVPARGGARRAAS